MKDKRIVKDDNALYGRIILQSKLSGKFPKCNTCKWFRKKNPKAGIYEVTYCGKYKKFPNHYQLFVHYSIDWENHRQHILTSISPERKSGIYIFTICRRWEAKK